MYSGPVSALITLVWGMAVTLLAIYAAYGCMAVLYAIVLVWRWSPPWLPPLYDLDFLCFRFATYSLMGSVIVLFARLVWSAWHERSVPRVRGQLSIILGGLCVALLPISTSFAGALSRQSHYFVDGLDVRYLMLALPLAFAYVIVRYQTFRSAPPPLFIAVIVLITAALIASAGDWLVRLLFPALQHSVFAPMLIVALLAGGLWSGQGVFQRTLGRIFKWEESSYRAVKHFAERVAAQRALEQLPQTIAQALVTEMKFEQAAVWLWDGAEGAGVLTARAGGGASSSTRSIELASR